MSNNAIRRKILQTLRETYAKDSDAYISGKDLQSAVGCSLSELRSNVGYLEEKNYIRVDWAYGGEFATRIRAEGIDLLEDESEFNRKFPQSVIQISQTHFGQGPQIGYVGSGSSVTIIQDSFSKIYDALEERKLGAEDKQIIEKKVNELRDELGKDNPSSSKIAKIIGFLKQNANWIIPLVSEAVKKIIASKYGTSS